MCFSAEASFTTAALLSGMGIATLRVAVSRSQFFLAAIPILFAIQQFSEGIIWLGLNGDLVPNLMLFASEATFLVFAFLIWPVWIPLSIMLAEKNLFRKRVLMATLAGGVVLTYMNLMYGLSQPEVSVKVMNHSIQYVGNAPKQIFFYPFVTLLPCFISSIKNMPAFGIFIVVAYVVAEYFYSTNFVSVWCFFSALTSVSLYKILKDLAASEVNDISSVN